MKKANFLQRIFSMFLAVLISISTASFTSLAESAECINLKFGTGAYATVANGGRITLSSDISNIHTLIGESKLRISLPEFLTVKSVKTPFGALTENEDYSINLGNTLIILTSFDLSGLSEVEKNLEWYIDVEVAAGTEPGVYPLSVTEKTMFSNMQQQIIPYTADYGLLRITNNEDFKAGDTNSDRNVNSVDLAVIREHLLGDGTLFNSESGDMHPDGVINILDLVALKKYFVSEKLMDTVYLSATGSDSADGSAGSPVSNLNHALLLVANGGIVNIVGTYTLDDTFKWLNNGKNVVITGGELNASKVTNFEIGSDVSFENMTLRLKENQTVYACQNSVKIADGVVSASNYALVDSSYTEHSQDPKAGRKIVWEDNFDGTALNSDNWRILKPGVECTETVFVSDDEHQGINSNGNLLFKATKTTSTVEGKICDTPVGIDTYNKMCFKYGYIEMRARVPFRKSAWPSFWMQTRKKTCNWLAEIDIFEVFSSSEKVSPTLHKWGANKHDYTYNQLSSYYFSQHQKDISNLSNEFHTYGFNWTEKKMQWLVDGECYSEFMIDGSTDFGTNISGVDGFHDYALVKLGLGVYTTEHAVWSDLSRNSEPVAADDLDTPIEYEIEYIRLYQNTDKETLKLGAMN